jgi:hypothetical protein
MSQVIPTRGYETSDIYLQGEYELINYNRALGAYKPHFAGIPDDYYPASTCDVVVMVLFVTLMILGGVAIMIGFLYWDLAVGTKNFVTVWVIVDCVFIGVLLVSIFFGGKARLR